jgi:hypothetical protein
VLGALAFGCGTAPMTERSGAAAELRGDASRGGENRLAGPIATASAGGENAGARPAVPGDPDPGGTTCEVTAYRAVGPLPTALEACQAGMRSAECEARRTVAATAARTPYLSIEVIEAPDRSKKALQYGLLLRLSGGWFLRHLGTEGKVTMEEFGFEDTPPSTFEKREYYELPTLRVVDVLAGGSPEIVLSYANPDGSFREKIPEGQQLQVCGVGASGEPACSVLLFLTTKPRQAVEDAEALFGPDGEVLELEGDALRECRVAL